MSATPTANNPVTTPVSLIRKKRLLEKLPFSKSTLHDLMKRDLSFPRPIYLNGGRIPFWREHEVDAWIAASDRQSRGVPKEADVPAATPAGGASASHAHECEHPTGIVPQRAPRITLTRKVGDSGLNRTIKVEARKTRVFHAATAGPIAVQGHATQAAVDETNPVTPVNEPGSVCVASATPQVIHDWAPRNAEIEACQPLQVSVTGAPFQALLPAPMQQPTSFANHLAKGLGPHRVW